MLRTVIASLIVLTLIFIALIVGMGMGFMFSGDEGFTGGDRVAVLRVDNVILDSQTYIEGISKIEKDESVKAVVLRINSPGGAVAPSQEIYAEIKELNEKKPVVASIGTVGASGGYYIACAARKILANPGSITGSIGVIAHFVNYGELLDWAKVDVEVIKSGKFKDVGSPVREFTGTEKEYMQGLIDNVHSQFKLAVSKARGLGSDKLSEVADGRVFTGEQAKALGLVDELGSISDAVRIAGTMGGIKGDPELVYYPKGRRNILDLLLSKIETQGLAAFPARERFGLFYIANIVQ